MAILSKKTWQRHTNPWSGWLRMLSYPLIFIPLWYHNWYALGVVILWFIINPIIFPVPKSTDNWMSKGVLGEELWTKKYHWDFSQLLNYLNALFFFPALYFTYQNMFWPTLYCATLPFIFKLWFLDRMVTYYEKHKK